MSSSVIKMIQKSAPDMAIQFTSKLFGGMILKETVQSFFRGQFRKITTGSREKPFSPVINAERAADEIIGLFEEMNIQPSLIGIDGIPGAGKSTLGRTLSSRLGLNWRTLIWNEMKHPIQFEPVGIYENVRLIRTQNIEMFDVLIYIDLPAEIARKRVIDRDRNGMLADIVQFQRMKKVGDIAFELLDAREFTIEQPYIRMKIRSNAFNHLKHIHGLMEKKGMLWNQTMNKEEKLFALCYGKRKKGILAYANYSAYNDVLLSAINETFGGVIQKTIK